MARELYRVFKVIVLSLVVVCALFPPWVSTLSREGAPKALAPAGYSFVFDPPSPRFESPIYGMEIDLKRLSVQLLAIGAVFGIGFVLRRRES